MYFVSGPPSKAANDNVKPEDALNRAHLNGTVRLNAILKALAAVGATGSLTPQGQQVIANLLRSFL
ncbi:MAG: hypothetical protein NBV63_02945 [Candidatus Pacebacteria bacterium]|nr:hypothetical protein [Candidatus Paceibacterota bacterium]